MLPLHYEAMTELGPGGIRYCKTEGCQLPNGVETLVPGGAANSKVESGIGSPTDVRVGDGKLLAPGVVDDDP